MRREFRFLSIAFGAFVAVQCAALAGQWLALDATRADLQRLHAASALKQHGQRAVAAAALLAEAEPGSAPAHELEERLRDSIALIDDALNGFADGGTRPARGGAGSMGYASARTALAQDVRAQWRHWVGDLLPLLSAADAAERVRALPVGIGHGEEMLGALDTFAAALEDDADARRTRAASALAAAMLLAGLIFAAVVLRAVGSLRRAAARQEAARRELEQRARDNEVLTAVANRTDNLVVVTDSRGRIEWVNPSFERVSGYAASEVLGHTPGHLLAGPDTDRQTIATIHALMAAGRGFSGVELLNYTKSGAPYWVELEVQPLRDASGRLTRYIGIESVITARRAAAQALERAKHEADEANLAKSRFLSRASHELRTPLNAILGFTQLLRAVPAGTAFDERHQWQLQAIESSGRHLLALIEDTLDLSRIEAGEMKIECRAFNVAKACRRAIDSMQADAQRAGVEILATFDARPVWALGDPLRVGQVLLNLLSNAVKYNRRGGLVWVSIHRAARDRIDVTVRDTGVGLSAAQTAELFQPFNRAGAERTPIPGTGIGLSIARRLALLMGGDLRVASEPGEGSAFTVTMPAVEPGGAGVDSGFTPLEPALQPSPVCGHVLYVEDDRFNAQLFTAALESQHGVTVRVAPTHAEALELLRRHRFDLVVADINLCDASGIALPEDAAGLAPTPLAPMVALSADATPATRASALQAGFREYWVKPIAPAALAAGVARLLERRA